VREAGDAHAIEDSALTDQRSEAHAMRTSCARTLVVVGASADAGGTLKRLELGGFLSQM
jgi:hypothetical protein